MTAVSLPSFRQTKVSKGDFDAYFGLLVDGLSKTLLAIGIMTELFGMPIDFIYRNVLPGLALATFLGNGFYAFEAYTLSKKTGKPVTSIPFGVGTPQIMGWLFLIMGPVYWNSGDHHLAWQVGIASAFIGGMIELTGYSFARPLAKFIPRSALLGNLAASGFIWMTIISFFVVYQSPYVALFSSMVLLILHYGQLSKYLRLPIGLIAIGTGTIIAIATGKLDIVNNLASMESPSLYLPIFAGSEILAAFDHIAPYLTIIIPLQITNFLTTLQCVQTAKIEGDEYDLKKSIIADGTSTIIGSLFGNPFPTTMYYGHTTWKQIGAEWKYSLGVGITYIIFCVFGLVSTIFHLVPYEATIALLMLVGMTTCSHALVNSNEEYVMAFLMSIVPIVSQYLTSILDNLVSITGDDAIIDKLTDSGVYSQGIIALGNGGFISSLLLSCFIAFVIKQNFRKSSVFMLILSLCTFVGLIHSQSIELFPESSFDIAGTYLALALFLFAISFFVGNNVDDSSKR